MCVKRDTDIKSHFLGNTVLRQTLKDGGMAWKFFRNKRRNNKDNIKILCHRSFVLAIQWAPVDSFDK